MHKKKYDVFSITVMIVLILYVVSLFIPVAWALINSLKDPLDFYDQPISLPKKFLFENYKIAFNKFNIKIPVYNKGVYLYNIIDMFVNSVIISGLCSLVSAFVPCTMAYLSSKFDYKFSKVIYSIVIIAMILPIVGSLPSELQMLRTLNLYDKLIGIIIMKSNFLGLNFLLFYASFKALPIDYSDAAEVDGANHFTIYFRIMLAFVFPTLMVICVLQFVSMWNEYLTTLLYLPSMPTLAYGMYFYSLSTESELSFVPLQLAGSMIVSLPIMIMFIFLKKYMIGNLTVGGLKG